jgi:hypothetical protein
LNASIYFKHSLIWLSIASTTILWLDSWITGANTASFEMT